MCRATAAPLICCFTSSVVDMKNDRSFSRPISPTSSGARSSTTPRALARSSTASPSTATRSISTPSPGATRTPSIARGTRRSRPPTRTDPHTRDARRDLEGRRGRFSNHDPISTDRCGWLQQISSGVRSVSFDTSCTMLRAAWPRRLIVSSTFPAPAKGRLSIAARRALDTERPSASVIAPERTSATVRSRSTRSISWAIMRSRKARSPPCENGGVAAPRQSRTICHRRSTSESSTASASEAPT